MQAKYDVLVAIVIGILGHSTSVQGAVVFSDSFEAATPLSDAWTIASDPDTNVVIVDYSDFDLLSLFGVGSGINLGIPEAPNSSTGSPSTGVVFTANTSLGTPASVNLISKSMFDLSEFRFQYDVFLLSEDQALAANNSTETTVWGVGRTTATPTGRANRSSAGDGVWGWLTTENGIGEEDAALNSDTSELADIGDTFDPGAASLFDAAFEGRRFANDSPLGSWVTVRAEYDGTDFSVFFNDILFFAESVSPEPGSIMVGYSDPFGSISSSPDFQFGVIDNVILEDLGSPIPEPATALMLGMGLAVVGFRRRTRQW